MKASDYIIEFLISKKITDVFGYPGGVVCHLMDSLYKYRESISTHTNYHEQASAFAACGYAQASSKCGVAFATSGPGATNLITGVCNAYYDSIPVIFITGQVDTYAQKGDLKLRQKGFQETDIVSMVKHVTKYSVCVESAEKLQECLETAYHCATSGRPGPVLLDIPADIQRAEMQICSGRNFISQDLFGEDDIEKHCDYLIEAFFKAERPCFLLGSAIKQSDTSSYIRSLLDKIQVPVVASMLAFDVLPYDHPANFGFVGTNGHRYANFILAKSDLIITLGSRLDLKQVGGQRSAFSPNATLIRIDIDQDELDYKVRNDEVCIRSDIKLLLPKLVEKMPLCENKYEKWLSTCEVIKQNLQEKDFKVYHKIIAAISEKVPDDTLITADVGHNQVWVAQSFKTKRNQSVYFSGGLGSMGYSLPAAIGAFYGKRHPVISINGDGGIQMNIQELQFLRREDIPVTVIVINNYALGMIRHFQEMNFNRLYTQTTSESGYAAPDFAAIAKAYGLEYVKVESEGDLTNISFNRVHPSLMEIQLPIDTYLEPKFGNNRPNQDQEPEIDRSLYNYLMNL